MLNKVLISHLAPPLQSIGPATVTASHVRKSLSHVWNRLSSAVLGQLVYCL